jgi:hypothetical protein
MELNTFDTEARLPRIYSFYPYIRPIFVPFTAPNKSGDSHLTDKHIIRTFYVHIFLKIEDCEDLATYIGDKAAGVEQKLSGI